VAVPPATLTRPAAQARRRRSKPLLSEEALSLVTTVKLVTGAAGILLAVLVCVAFAI